MRRTLFVGTFGLALAMSVPLAYGQGKGQQPAPTPAPSPSPGTPGGTPRTPGSPNPNIPGQPGQPGLGEPRTPFPEPIRNIFLSGKVIMEDGTPPPEPVIIERVCTGTPRPEGYTDSKGRFNIQLGQNRAVMPDASVSGTGGFGGMSDSRTGSGMGGPMGSADAQTMGCELRAALAGFRSDVIQLTGRRPLDNPDVGTIVLHRLANVEGTTISATSLAAPKDAKKSFDKGVDSLKKKKWDDAQKHLQKAVEIYPKYAAAWFRLGVAHQQQNNAVEARKAYDQALAADPKYVEPYRQIAILGLKEQNWQMVAETTDKLLRLDPVDFPEAYYFNSVANANLRNLDAAEKSAREALRLDPNHRNPRIEYVLGFILANKQDYAGAAQFMQSYLDHAPNASDADTVRKQLIEVQKFAATPKPQP